MTRPTTTVGALTLALLLLVAMLQDNYAIATSQVYGHGGPTARPSSSTCRAGPTPIPSGVPRQSPSSAAGWTS